MRENSFSFLNIFGKKWFILFLNILNIIYFVLMACLLPIQFEENDDAVMCLIANGSYSGNPDGHLVFINALYGWVLAGFYSLTKAVEWYTLSFCILQVVAMTVIECIVVRDKGLHPLLKGAFLVFMYVIWARIIVAFQFTTTAGLLCFSGCLALLQHSKKWRYMGVAAIFVASLIRFSAAGLVGLLCAPLFIKEFVRDKRFSYWVMTIAFLALLGHFMDGLFYHQKDWAYYRAYNAVRGKIHDNPNAHLLSESDLPEGIAMEDYQLFCGFKGDPKILDLQNLQIIESRMKKKMSFNDVMNNFLQIKMYWITLLLLGIGYLSIIFLSIFKQPDRKRVVLFLVTIALFVLVLVYIGGGMSLKNRVFLCMLLPMVYQMIAFYIEDSYVKSRLLNVILLVLIVGLVLKYVKQVDKVRGTYLVRQEMFDRYEFPLVASHTCAIYGCHLECLHPFHVKDTPFRSIGLGWMTEIPFNTGRLESHLDFVDSDIVCFSGIDSPPKEIANSIERNYGIPVKLEIVDHNEKYALFKFVGE